MVDHLDFINFNFYGLLLGLGALTGFQFYELALKHLGLKIEHFSSHLLVFLAGGLVIARLWHVLTTWDVYQTDYSLIFQVWRGGLSIWGFVYGGILALMIARLKQTRQFIDALSFALPIAQAIGRAGNWFNQELYGLPSNLPWSIYIDPAHRLPGYETVEYYHPLFFYEILGLLGLWGLLWRLPKQANPGFYFIFYLLGYTAVRFCLDFIRLDQLMFANSFLSFNQVISLAFLLFIFIWRRHATLPKKNLLKKPH